MILSGSVSIGRGLAEVFALLADFSHDPSWRAGVLEMRPLGAADAPGGAWSRQVEVRRVPGRIVETEAVITAFDPPRRITLERASGPIRPAVTYDLAPIEGGTLLSLTLEVPLRGLRLLAWPVVALLLRLLVRRSLASDLARLRALLEHRAAPRGA